METNYASFGRRVSATLADSFVLIVVSYLLGFVLNFFTPDLKDLSDIVIVIALSMIIPLVLTLVYYLVCWLKFDGATIGKKLAAIKIVKTNGTPLTLGTAIIRIIGYGISMIVFGLGYLWVLWDKNKQGWHDKIADTYVINTGAKQNNVLLGIFIIGFLLLLTLNIFRN